MKMRPLTLALITAQDYILAVFASLSRIPKEFDILIDARKVLEFKSARSKLGTVVLGNLCEGHN